MFCTTQGTWCVSMTPTVPWEVIKIRAFHRGGLTTQAIHLHVDSALPFTLSMLTLIFNLSVHKHIQIELHCELSIFRKLIQRRWGPARIHNSSQRTQQNLGSVTAEVLPGHRVDLPEGCKELNTQVFIKICISPTTQTEIQEPVMQQRI